MQVVSAGNSEYEDGARREIEIWRGKRPSRVIQALGKPGEFIGFPIRKALETDGGRMILEKVVGSLVDAGTWRLESDKVLETYRAAGYDVQALADVRTHVPLQDMDREAKKHRLAATGTLAVEGAIVGPALAIAATAAGTAAARKAFASGGKAGPAAAAAGLAVVGTATMVETTFLIAFCCRRIASIAACYGYDVADDRERAFALHVLSVATAQNLEAKEVALADLGHLAGRLGLKKQPWHKLEDRSLIARTIRDLADRIGWNITQAQLRRVLTVVGAVMGAGFNGHLGHSTTQAGYFLYRERALDELRPDVDGGGGSVGVPQAPTPRP
jgi:hypothetical protein